MEAGRPSHTAMISALMRAAHPLLDRPPIFDDPWAARLIGLEDDAGVLSAVESLQREFARTLSSSGFAETWIRTARLNGALRDRYIEDELQAARERGVAQYVILGAGFDGSAYRQRGLHDGLRVFELDHPATQHSKRERLQQLGVPTPPHLSFVPVDFEMQSILEVLGGTGYRHDQPTFFAWPGVTFYLTTGAIDHTLQEVAAAAPGSEIVFDYVLPPELMPAESREVLRMLQAMAESRGEPGRSSFSPEQIERRVRALGFTQVWDLGGASANARYCAARSDGLRIPEFLHMLKARVDHT